MPKKNVNPQDLEQLRELGSRYRENGTIRKALARFGVDPSVEEKVVAVLNRLHPDSLEQYERSVQSGVGRPNRVDRLLMRMADALGASGTVVPRLTWELIRHLPFWARLASLSGVRRAWARVKKRMRTEGEIEEGGDQVTRVLRELAARIEKLELALRAGH